MKIYAVAGSVQKNGNVRVYAVVVKAHSKAEAIGDAMIQSYEKFPMVDGYFSHSVVVREVPGKWIKELQEK